MDHSTFTYLMLPGTGFADFFGRDDTAQQMADRTACFIDHS
jgi:protein SCO1